MNRIATPTLAAFAASLLAACGGGSQAENSADQLRNAAEQSSPEAANTLMSAANAIEQQNIQDPAAVQDALNQAGNAQVPQQGGQQPANMGPGATPNAPSRVGGGGGANPGGSNQGGNIEGPGVGNPPQGGGRSPNS